MTHHFEVWPVVNVRPAFYTAFRLNGELVTIAWALTQRDSTWGAMTFDSCFMKMRLISDSWAHHSGTAAIIALNMQFRRLTTNMQGHRADHLPWLKRTTEEELKRDFHTLGIRDNWRIMLHKVKP